MSAQFDPWINEQQRRAEEDQEAMLIRPGQTSEEALFAAERKAGKFRLPGDPNEALLRQFRRAMLRVNKCAIRIQGEFFGANQAQLAWVTWQIIDGKKQAWFEINRAAAFNGIMTMDMLSGAIVCHPDSPFDWLTDADLALLGAEMIEADEPTILQG